MLGGQTLFYGDFQGLIFEGFKDAALGGPQFLRYLSDAFPLTSEAGYCP